MLTEQLLIDVFLFGSAPIFCLVFRLFLGEADRGFKAEALLSMIENRREQCLSHPLCVKYVSMKWQKRGFRYNLAAILLVVFFHTCLMIFTTQIRGNLRTKRERFSKWIVFIHCVYITLPFLTHRCCESLWTFAATCHIPLALTMTRLLCGLKPAMWLDLLIY